VSVVFDGDLGLAVRPSPAQRPVPPQHRELPGELVRHLNGRRHQFGCLVAREAEHHSLVTGAAVIDPLGDIGRLLVNAHQDTAGLPVDAVFGPRVADLLDRLADEAGDVDICLGCDLAEHQDGPGAERRFAGDPSQRVLAQDRIQDGVADLVSDLVGMALGDRLRSEEAMACCGHWS
jgi:hypothetical protein